MTPFNTGKVLIGSNYHPQPTWTPTHTEAMLQDALLAKPRSIDWEGIKIIVGCSALVGLAYLIGWLSA